MHNFRCYFLDGLGHIMFPAELGAEDLEVAKLRALFILQEQVAVSPLAPHAFEIWERDVMLFRSY